MPSIYINGRVVPLQSYRRFNTAQQKLIASLSATPALSITPIPSCIEQQREWTNMKGRLEEKIRQQEHELTSQKTAYSTLLVQEPDLKRRFEEAKAQFDAELGKKSQEIERLGEQIRGKDASLTDLERKIAAQVAELEQLKRIVESFDTEKTILTGDYTRQIKELEAKVATLAGQVKAADKKVREATAREKDIKQLLEQKIAQIQELEKEKLEQPFEIGNPLRRKQMQTTTRVSPKVLQSLGVYRNPAAIRR